MPKKRKRTSLNSITFRHALTFNKVKKLKSVLNLMQNINVIKTKRLKHLLSLQQALTVQHLRCVRNVVNLTQSAEVIKLTPSVNLFNIRQVVEVEVLQAHWRRYKFLCVYSDGKSHQTVEMDLETLKRLLRSIR